MSSGRQRLGRSRAYTLAEVIAVLVVVAILAALALPRFVELGETARRRVVLLAVTELNGREMVAWQRGIVRDRGEPDDEAVFADVVSSGLGSDFTWETSPNRTGSSQLLFRGQTYRLRRLPSNTVRAGIWGLFEGFIQDLTTLDPADFTQQPNNSWTVDPDAGFSTTQWGARIYTPNPLGETEYVIGVTAQLGPPRADLTSADGGYGVFFDAVLNASGQIQSGYILQFDRGMGAGEIIVRRWEDGKELSTPVLRVNDRSIVPRKTDDPDWWTREHNLAVRVTNVPGEPGQRQLDVILDGAVISSSFTFSPNGGDTHTGLRSWGSFDSPTQFTMLEIDSP